MLNMWNVPRKTYDNFCSLSNIPQNLSDSSPQWLLLFSLSDKIVQFVILSCASSYQELTSVGFNICSNGNDFCFGRLSNRNCLIINDCTTDCRPRVAFRGHRNPYGNSWKYGCLIFGNTCWINRAFCNKYVNKISRSIGSRYVTCEAWPKASGVRVHSDRGGALAEPKTVVLKS